MRWVAKSYFLSVLILCFSGGITQAAVPQLINYQGRLTNAAGQAVADGNYLIKFVIYDAASGGNVLWDNNYRTLPVIGGLFSHALGDSTALPPSLFATDTSRWLGIKVGADPELTPRTKLTSTAFAYKAQKADTASLATSIPDGSVTALQLADDAVTGIKIQNGSIGSADLGQNGATTGQVLKWDGTTWVAADESAGNPGPWAKAGSRVTLLSSVDSVGIGTMTPADKLDVAGNIHSSGNIHLEASTATAGQVLIGGKRFIHSWGTHNILVGEFAGNVTMAGSNNTVNGYIAMMKNTTGAGNTISGSETFYNNTTGSENTASGHLALYNNTTGIGNCAIGTNALYGNTTGSYNTAIGYGAGSPYDYLTNTTAIGYGAAVAFTNSIRLGNAAIQRIEGQVPYSYTSDQNQKENFQPIDGNQVLSKIRNMSLPSWNYKGHDLKHFRHYGPMAQDFFAAFGHDGVGLCGDSTTINSGDLEGILMIAVQALERRMAEVEITRAENEEIKSENAELKARLQRVEVALGKVAGQGLVHR